MKKPLVLLHGWGVDSSIWNGILPALETHFELTVVDLPGYGCDTDYNGEYSLDAVANEVLARAPEKAIWVGWSLGGTIALAAAISHPERFLKLQLVSVTPQFLNSADWDRGVEPEPFESLARDFEVDYEKAIRKFLLLQLFTKDRSKIKMTKTLVRELSQVLSQRSRPTNKTLQSGLNLLSQTNLRPRLNELEVETQVIAGQNDQVVPMAASEFLFDQLECGHSFHPFNAGHLPFLESQSKYIATLTTFTNSTS